MTIYDLSINEKGRILSFDTDEDLKNRLHSFGVKRGSTILIKNIAPKKSTISIVIGKTVLALRDEEARKIQVEKL